MEEKPNEDLEDPTLSPSDEVLPEEPETPEIGEDEKPGKRSAEARINELLSKNKELEAKLGDIEERLAPPPPPTTPAAPLTPEVQKAIEFLKDQGFVTKTELDKERQYQEDRAALTAEHTKLAQNYSGADGRPKYDSDEVEKYMKSHGIYDPEVAYKAMHETELFDWKLKKAESDRKKRPFSEKPGSPGGDRGNQAITREKIAEWLKTPEGRAKYEANRPKIMELLAEGQL
jgi:hypothetical protein